MTDTHTSPVTACTFRQHDLKIWPEFFADLLADRKQFQLRKNDRDFHMVAMNFVYANTTPRPINLAVAS
jgi:hypothetical protein